jgi:hypothetical protein
MLPKVPKSVREWTFTLPSELHVGSWSPKFSKGNYKGQNPSAWKVLYINGNLLKLRYLKWSCIAHLDFWNTGSDQKKGQESNWQFDYWPLKVNNQPYSLACRRRATYLWKALDEGYNLASNLIAIEGLDTKLWGFKVAEVPNARISGLPLGSPRTKTIWMWPLWTGAKYNIKGKVVVSPKSEPWWVLWIRVARGSS